MVTSSVYFQGSSTNSKKVEFGITVDRSTSVFFVNLVVPIQLGMVRTTWVLFPYDSVVFYFAPMRRLLVNCFPRWPMWYQIPLASSDVLSLFGLLRLVYCSRF